MSQTEVVKTSDRKHLPLSMCIFALMIGVTGFYRVAQSPHFEAYRTVDVLQLLVSGASIGVTLVVFFMWLARHRT